MFCYFFFVKIQINLQDFKISIDKKNFKEALGIIKDLDGDYYLDRSKVIFNICKDNVNDIKKLVPKANKFNTFFLSEYNDYLSKKFDLPLDFP